MFFQNSELLKENLRHEINTLAPNAHDVAVNIIKNNFGEYKTKITVRLKGKIIYAEKLDRVLSSSVKRCYRAIVKQIQKIKMKKNIRLET